MKWMSLALVMALTVGLLGCGDSASSGNKKVTITAPNTVELKPGEKKNFAFTIKREGFDEDVKLSFKGLPEGVKADGPTVKKGDTKYEVPFEAGEKEGETKYDILFKASETAAVTDKKEATVKGEATGLKTDPVKFNVKVTK